MNKFSRRSLENLATADPRLRAAAQIVLEIKDHSVIQGHRGKEEQNAAYDAGYSQVRWPNGKHNKNPSLAIDVQTYPRPRKEQDLREEQIYLLGMYAGVLHMLGYKFRTGWDWDGDGQIEDNDFDDGFHVEIAE